MTIREYLSNPYGKGSAFSSVTQQRISLDEQYLALQMRMSCRMFLYRNTAIYHIVVPSQTDPNSSYDVVIEVPLPEDNTAIASVMDLNFKAFSNCPSFIFTYAHVFRKNNMLCKWLENKYSKIVKKNAPIQRNQYGVIGFERSLYLAMKYITMTGRVKVSTVKTVAAKPKSYGEISSSVRTQEQIMSNTKSRLKKQALPDIKSHDETDPESEVGRSSKPVSSGKIQKTSKIKTLKKVKSTKKI